MSYALGLKTVKRLCVEQQPLAWHKAKLSPVFFKPTELPVFEWVNTHVKEFHALPQVETLIQHFPEMAAVDVPEPSAYYTQLLVNKYCHERINKANLDAQSILKDDQDAHEVALESLRSCIRDITAQKYRHRVLDVVADAPKLLLQHYFTANTKEGAGIFGWPYMDHQTGGIMPGEVASIVGRPALGKTWSTLWTGVENWKNLQENVLYASMEMMILPITQRLASIYTKTPIHQLKTGGFSSYTFDKFHKGLQALKSEKAKFYVMDGNLAASVEDIYELANILECRIIIIDGAYLLRHKNTRLDRYTRAAENVEMMKRYTSDLDLITLASWQFNREASKKQKKTGESGDVEDIGYSDAIGQISSIVLSLFQEDTVETMKSRKIRVIKGRNGEVGQFSIAWDFDVMDFSQTYPEVGKSDADKGDPESEELQWI